MKNRRCAEHLTDEEVLKEFVKRFECDGAVLIYRDSEIENGFGRWRNANGSKWVTTIFKILKNRKPFNINDTKHREGITIPLTLN